MLGVPSFQANPNLRKNVLERVKSVCQQTLDNIKYLQVNEEMKSRTLVVRYEDIAVKPFKYAKRILNFAGLNYTSEVNDWIVKNTQRKTGKRKRSSNNPFTTNRDSEQTALKWRSSVSLSDALTIQEFCNDEMEQLGYLPVNKTLSKTTQVITDLPSTNKNS